ncbi:MoaB/Mog domain-containing protein [Mrakia frigida]|uniref:flavin adenine dinucleotide pyrophosphatase n=1 Tax=Mrakia frigida TaxID=29902 RepID=UPI003FCBF88C
MSTATATPTPTFPVSEVGSNPLGEGKFIRTAGMIVIGDEVLNGKTRDTNSNFFARHCFDLGIELKRIETIADDPEEIAECARRMVKNYDWVVSTGGVGPTHDDITYGSLADAFEMPLEHHPETLKRMWAMGKARYDLEKQTPEQREARERMGLLPSGKGSEVIFVEQDKWVPVVRLQGRLCIFPGIPALFTSLLVALTPYLSLPPDTEKPFRHLVHTEMAESNIAPGLGRLAEEVRKEGIRVGSYPALQKGVTISLIGKNQERLKELEQRIVQEFEGTVIKAGKLGAEVDVAKL